MRPELPWNVAGIPPEAREAARAAARRDGLSVGEWLTRRILRSFADAGDANGEAPRNDWPAQSSTVAMADDPRPPRSDRGDSEAMLSRVSRSESDSQDAFKRIEEQLRSLSRRLDSAERSQTENNRAMSKAATEINIAAREQAQAFDQLGTHVVGLNDRLDRVERQADSSGTREAVKALQQGLSRLADQISQTAHESTAQISSLAGNVESLAGKFLQARNEADLSARTLEQRLDVLEKAIEERKAAASSVEPELHRQAAALQQVSDVLDRLNTRLAANEAQAAGSMARVEESIVRLEHRGTDSGIDGRLQGIERMLSDISGRLDKAERNSAGTAETVEDSIKALSLRLETTEKKNAQAVSELRTAFNDTLGRVYPGPVPANGAASGGTPLSAAAPNLDLPPFANQPPPPAYQTAPQNDPFAPPPPTFEPSPPFANEPPPPAFPNDPFASPPAAQQPFAGPNTGESYLAAARRAAKSAAMQADAERARGPMGAFTWGANRTADMTAAKPKRYGLIAGLAVVAILAAVAGVMLSQRMSASGTGTTAPSKGINALFQNKPAPAITVPQSPPPAATQSVPPQAPGSPVLKPTTPPARTATQTPAPPAAKPAPVAPSKPAAATQPPPQAPALSPLQQLTAMATKGNPAAQLVLGLKYLEGDGVTQSDAEAAKWLAKAAAQGQVVAEYRLGTLYERGRGVPSDAAKAAHWYEEAALHGNRKAMHNLAVAYAEGAGVQKNYSEAARWFSKAANLGLADSQFNLAVLYERGMGVPQSLVDAYKWYAIAAAQGDTESKSRIDALGTQLSADERAAAQKAAAAFRPQTLDRGANVAPETGARE